MQRDKVEEETKTEKILTAVKHRKKMANFPFFSHGKPRLRCFTEKIRVGRELRNCDSAHMQTLVIGSQSPLGRALCARLEKTHSIDLEVSSLSEALGSYNEETLSTIYALIDGLDEEQALRRHPGELWIQRQRLHTELLDWWQKTQPQAKLVCLGSRRAYDPSFPSSEENYLKGEPRETVTTYAMCKRMLLVGLKALHKQYGLSYLYLIPPALYDAEGPKSLFIHQMAESLLRARQQEDPIIFEGEPSQKREVLHTQDFIDALLQLSATEQNRVINVCSGAEHSLEDYAQLLCALLDVSPERVTFDARSQAWAKEKPLLTDSPIATRPLQEGLKELVAALVQDACVATLQENDSPLESGSGCTA